MENLIATIDELNDAIEIIKAECSAHEKCEDCRFVKRIGCKLFGRIPIDWEKIEEDEQDETN